MLFVNPRSGGGKATQIELVPECRARGIEPVVFEPGDDLTALAAAAVGRGCDMLGVAGGDGSQAAVAAIAIEHDLPFVCVPAGTRNHFAFDIGVNRRDVVGALDAYAAGGERRIDVALVNGRVFLNNVAMGLYGAIVESRDYRDHKVRTAIATAAELLGPQGEPFDLRFTGKDGTNVDSAALVLVSNNPYVIDRSPRTGTRGGMDRGVLGVIAVTAAPPHGLTEWTTAEFRVDSGAPISVGIDGESASLDPPLLFESRPQALRVRVVPRRRAPHPRPRPARR